MAGSIRERVKALLPRLVSDFVFYASHQLKIATKEGGVKKLELNKSQQFVHERLEAQLFEEDQVRALILKGRQQGISTYVEARFYHKVQFRRGVRAFILTHMQEATDNLFDMVQRYHDNVHSVFRPHTSTASAKELKFDKLDSGYKVGTAGSKGTGRSSTIHYFHGSEVAFWPNAQVHAAGALQAVPKRNRTEVIHESTGNGIGGYFHDQWQKAEAGQSDFIAIFVPWKLQDEYRTPAPESFKMSSEEAEVSEIYGLDIDQIYWSHQKNIELGGSPGEYGWLFLQEYPFCAADAFQSSGEDKLCSTHSIARARKRNIEIPDYSPRVMGVDPARFGDDRTSIIDRSGHKAYNMISYSKKSVTEVASIVARRIEKARDEGKPYSAVFVDVGGLGAGVVDILNDLGYRSIVRDVNFGERASDDERYYLKRSEIWCEMADWLNGEVDIPDCDSLHSDLTAPWYTYNVKNQKVLASKEQLRKEGIRSPDEGDALALTFSYPVIQIHETKKRKPRNWRTS